MKNIGFRIYEIEYIDKIKHLISEGYGLSYAGVCKLACLEGIDILYDRAFNQTAKLSTEDKLEEISNKITSSSRILLKEMKENKLVTYNSRTIMSALYNIVMIYLENGDLDFELAEKGTFDFISDRFVESFDKLQENME